MDKFKNNQYRTKVDERFFDNIKGQKRSIGGREYVCTGIGTIFAAKDDDASLYSAFVCPSADLVAWAYFAPTQGEGAVSYGDTWLNTMSDALEEAHKESKVLIIDFEGKTKRDASLYFCFRNENFKFYAEKPTDAIKHFFQNLPVDDYFESGNNDTVVCIHNRPERAIELAKVIIPLISEWANVKFGDFTNRWLIKNPSQ